MAEIAPTRTRGFAVIVQEVELGLRSIAVPLMNARGQVVAALNTGVAAVEGGAGTLEKTDLAALTKTRAGLRRVLP